MFWFSQGNTYLYCFSILLHKIASDRVSLNVTLSAPDLFSHLHVNPVIVPGRIELWVMRHPCYWSEGGGFFKHRGPSVHSHVQHCTPVSSTVHSLLITPQIQLFNFSCDENFPLVSDTIKTTISNSHNWNNFSQFDSASVWVYNLDSCDPIDEDAVSLHALTDQFCLVLFAQQNLNSFSSLYFISLIVIFTPWSWFSTEAFDRIK